MIRLLILLPIVAAVATLLTPSPKGRRRLLVGTAGLHLLLTAGAWLMPLPTFAADAWLGLDHAGRFFLGISSCLFFAVAITVGPYLEQNRTGRQREADTGSIFVNASPAVFCACLLGFLATMTLVAASRHLGVLWVAIEATTLVTAPLIYFHRQPRSLEATWKYLLVCSVGIALALIGNFLLVVASAADDITAGSLVVSDLVARRALMQGPWLKAAFVFLLVGYGTKMGLVPMHTWLPDAHSEAPSPVSALLSGALLNCAFLGILRAHSICVAAGLGDFSGGILIFFGVLSMLIAAAFIVGQTDFKRMLAYSSIEHMGLLALGAGLGGAATYGALLHALNHSLVKAALFLCASSFLAVYRTKLIPRIHGAIRVLPVSGWLWLFGFLAIAGSPPFGTFVGEFIILRTAFVGNHVWAGCLALLALTIAFIGLARAFISMALGPAPANLKPVREEPQQFWPPLALLSLALLLGLWIPARLHGVLAAAATLLKGGVP